MSRRPSVEYITPNDAPPYAVRKCIGGLEPIQIVGVDGFSILATVHKRKGYEEIAAKFAAAPELLDACRNALQIIEQLIPEESARGVAEVVIFQLATVIAKAEVRL